MPAIQIPPAILAPFGIQWQANGGTLKGSSPYSSTDLGTEVDKIVGAAFAQFVGGVPVTEPGWMSLGPPEQDCVEVGPVRIVGGVRPQNYDVGYRPDGCRFAFDSKTLNNTKSVGKNWNNMINDLATEATTVHSRFPYAVVGFIVLIPTPCIGGSKLSAMIETLERLGRRSGVEDPLYQAEAVSLALWDPATGQIDGSSPDPSSPIRIERFSEQVQEAYEHRYRGLPPHAV
ncbi:hypothetical protein [Rubrivirga sp. IMCC43871]|uniref:hypothetical protein n=1 Tax=Rubrivirga sp. IMCC43871 TaxID=3391575 RepID=UPI00399032F9